MIDVEHLPPEIVSGPPRRTPGPEPVIVPLRDALDVRAREHIVAALRSCGGCRKRTAHLLRISRKSLWEKMRQYEIGDDEIAAG
jgi:DNA-binding NtrC family response regulator